MRRVVLLIVVVIAVLASVNGASASHDIHGCTPARLSYHVCYRDNTSTWFPSGEPFRRDFLEVYNNSRGIDLYVYVFCTNRDTGKGEISGDYYFDNPVEYLWGGIPPVRSKYLKCPLKP